MKKLKRKIACKLRGEHEEMNYRTDLAVELDEMLTAARRGSGTPEAGTPVHNITGYLKKQSSILRLQMKRASAHSENPGADM